MQAAKKGFESTTPTISIENMLLGELENKWGLSR